MSIQIPNSWEPILSDQNIKRRLKNIELILREKKNNGHTIYPPDDQVFSALQKTPFKDVKAVILGQDPYHRAGQAHGLAFSVQPELKTLPPSLKNIFKELYADMGIQNTNGCLTAWAEQGVLLLNTCLTVDEGLPNSHKSIGWSDVTDYIISQLSAHKNHIIFVFWGKQAQSKRVLIDESKHSVLSSAHPAPFPFSTHILDKFSGSKPFSKINALLKEENLNTIDWKT